MVKRCNGLAAFPCGRLPRFAGSLIRRSLGSLISVAQSATCRTWQSARRGILLFFLPRQAAVSRPPLSCDLLRARSPVVFDRPRANTRPSFELRQKWLDWHSLSPFLVDRPGPAHGPVGAPASPLPPAHFGCACSAVCRAA